MNTDISGNVVKWFLAAARGALVIAASLLLCFVITKDNYPVFSVSLFIPLASFILFSLSAFFSKQPVSDTVTGVLEVIGAHLICAGWAGNKLGFLALYGAAGILGFAFGSALKKLDKKP